MGLLDVLQGMQNGPRGQSGASPTGGGQTGGGQTGGGQTGGGISPLTVAMLGLLAYKAVKSFSDPAMSGQAPQPTGAGSQNAGSGLLGNIVGRLFGGGAGAAAEAGTGGGAGDLIGSELGSLLGGAGAGATVSNGLANLVRQMQAGGLGAAAQSWVGTGANEAVAPNDLAKALGPETVAALAQRAGMNPADLLSGLAQHLPNLINHLTPNGRLPTADEASKMV